MSEGMTREELIEAVRAKRETEQGSAPPPPPSGEGMTREELVAAVRAKRAKQPAQEPITEEGTQKGIDAANEAYDRAKYGDPGIFDSLVSGAARSLPFVQRGAAAIGAGIDKLQNPEKGYGDLYDKRREDIQGRDAYIDEKHPAASFTGRVGATVAEASLFPAAAKVLNPVSVAGAGAVGALQSAGETRHDWTKNPEEAGLDTAIGGAVAAAGAKFIPPIVRAAVNNPVSKAAGKVVAPAAKLAAHFLGGVTPKNATYYWNNATRVRKAPTHIEIADAAANVSRKYAATLEESVSAGKMDLTQAQAKMAVFEKEISDNWHSRENTAKDDLKRLTGLLDTKMSELRAASVKASGYVEASDASLKELEREAGYSFDEKKRSLTQKLIEKRDAFKNAYSDKRSALRNTRPSTETAGDLVSEFEKFDRGLSTRSTEAFNTLEDSDAEISTHTLRAFFGAKMNRENIHGATLIGESGRAYNVFKEFYEFLGEMPDKLSGSDTKKILRMIDEEAYKSVPMGQRTPLGQRQLQEVRRNIDKQLKDLIPAYAEKMESLSADTRLAQGLRDIHITDKEKILRTLGHINDPIKGPAIRQKLQEFGKKTGRNYLGELSDFANAKDRLGSTQKMRELAQSLPEFEELAAVKKEAVKMVPEYKESYVKGYESKGDSVGSRMGRLAGHEAAAKEAKLAASATKGQQEYTTLEEAKAKFAKEFNPHNKGNVLAGQVASSQQRLNMDSASGKLRSALAEKKNNPISGWTEKSSYGKVKRVMGNKSVPTERELVLLGKKGDRNLFQEAKDRAVLDSFEQGFTHGSRNFNLWSAIGFIIGGRAVNEQHRPMFRMLGGVGGTIIDKIGPKMTQRAMDGLLALKDAGQFPALQAAARKGPTDFYMALMLLEKKDPNFKRIVDSIHNHFDSEEPTQ